MLAPNEGVLSFFAFFIGAPLSWRTLHIYVETSVLYYFLADQCHETNACSGRGTCTTGPRGIKTCECDSLYTGESCELGMLNIQAVM